MYTLEVRNYPKRVYKSRMLLSFFYVPVFNGIVTIYFQSIFFFFETLGFGGIWVIEIAIVILTPCAGNWFTDHNE